MLSPARLGLVLVLSGWAAFTGLLIHGAHEASDARHRAIMNMAVITPRRVSVPLTDTISLSVSSWQQLRPGQLWSFVNATQRISNDFTPTVTLVRMITPAWYPHPQLTEPAARALEQWAAAAKTAGHPILITSAYRSSADQQAVRSALIQSRGVAYAERFSAQPGHSEHQLGLAVDLTRHTPDCELSFDACSLDDETAAWLATTAPNYGFILRYPPGKERITGVAAEPWHFRYVGKEMAAAVATSGLTFDEIIAKLQAQQRAQ